VFVFVFGWIFDLPNALLASPGSTPQGSGTASLVGTQYETHIFNYTPSPPTLTPSWVNHDGSSYSCSPVSHLVSGANTLYSRYSFGLHCLGSCWTDRLSHGESCCYHPQSPWCTNCGMSFMRLFSLWPWNPFFRRCHSFSSPRPVCSILYCHSFIHHSFFTIFILTSDFRLFFWYSSSCLWNNVFVVLPILREMDDRCEF